MIEAEIQTHPTPFALRDSTHDDGRLYFISEMALEISHETPELMQLHANCKKLSEQRISCHVFRTWSEN